ncbi:MAG: hypothetical protein ACR2L2_00030 [Acidobacteriota bacterium]
MLRNTISNYNYELYNISLRRAEFVGAIAVSKKEEQQIQRLLTELRIPTKSGLIRAALNALQEKTEQERLRREIQESVRRCAVADGEENRELFRAGVAHRTRG